MESSNAPRKVKVLKPVDLHSGITFCQLEDQIENWLLDFIMHNKLITVINGQHDPIHIIAMTMVQDSALKFLSLNRNHHSVKKVGRLLSKKSQIRGFQECRSTILVPDFIADGKASICALFWLVYPFHYYPITGDANARQLPT